jgi:transcription termination factor Rho
MKKQVVEGILEETSEGYGFLRDPQKNFNITPNDAYVSPQLVRQHNLREGLLVGGELGKPAKPGQRVPLSRILTCNGLPVEQYALLPEIKSLTSIDPEEQLIMNREERDLTGRMIDLMTPLGRGQRGMIISPPKAGKTIILKHIAKAVLENHPGIKVMVLLVDERPEEVTDFRRDLNGAEVFHSSADQDVENHLRITSLTMNMAVRRVECGEDVIMLIDSLTRMGRAFNKEAYSGGKTLSGGLAANALELPRRFFGAARNIENGGSLTIMATILVDTGSRMDEVIFQEFKGTGNLELVLSRECAERRLFPAINIRESGTRKEHKILSPEVLKESHNLRRKVAEMKAPEALEVVIGALR